MRIKTILNKIILKIGIKIHNLESVIAAETLPVFGNQGRNVTIELPRTINNPDRIFIGNDVWLGPGAFLMAVKQYPGRVMQNQNGSIPVEHFHPKISIGDRVTSTGGLQLAAAREVLIENDVMFASNIHINDSLHGYDDANRPYKYQKLQKIAPIVVRTGSWIGQNVMIMPGVEIGRYSIIGANSIVTTDIPPQSIAFGLPAKVVKRWNDKTQKWDSVPRAAKGSSQ